jgi:hypothetical protein
MGDQTGKQEDATNFVLITILWPNFLLTSILTCVQQGLASRRVRNILPEYSSDEEEIEVKVSV